MVNLEWHNDKRIKEALNDTIQRGGVNMERIKLLALKAFLCLLFPALAGCQGRTGKGSLQEGLNTKPEEYFTLDSTVIGISTVATGLNVPWEITWGPDGWIWYSEIGGTVGRVNPATGEKKVLLHLDDVFTRTTPGLLGMAVHPDQEHNPYLFLLYTRKKGEDIVLNVMRYTLTENGCRDPKLLMEVPGAKGHNGSRIKVGADGNLYISTGEAARAEKSQNIQEPGGKVLRIRPDGSIPPGNPFPGNPVWAWGFRNPQGLTLAQDGRIYVSDHGEATDDEVNLVEKGGNYGWPDVRGFADTGAEKEYAKDSVVSTPLKAWTPTIAPAGAGLYASGTIPEWQNSLLLATLKGSSLRILRLNPGGTAIESETVLFEGKFGRLRDVCVSPAGDVYISTSNHDWNPMGTPRAGDDRIIRLFSMHDTKVPDSIPEYRYAKSAREGGAGRLSGERIYSDFCSACHKPDGKGIPGTFPPLSGTTIVSGEPEKLIKTVLRGIPGAGEPMPSFAFLDDKEIAAVLTYVRSHFSNSSGKISEEEVKQAR